MNTLRAIFFVLLSVLLLDGCGNSSNNNDTVKLNEIVPVSVTKVEKGAVDIQKTYGGTLEGVQQADIVAKISERITAINVKVGDNVKQGDAIIELEKNGPASQYLQAKANYENAEKNYERMQALLKEGAVSQQTVDQVETAYKVAKANYEASQSAVELIAPISGTITAINYNVGDWVNPGTDLATVADISQMIIKFSVSESDVQDLQIGKPVYVYSEFQKNIKEKGFITEINRSATIDSRSFLIKARFENTKDSFFKPGMFVKVNVVLESENNAVAVPTPSIIFNDNGKTVYIIKNGMSFPTQIQTGLSNDSITVVKSGLQVGDELVTSGMDNLSDSTKVSIVKD
jgi:membrane fusion protein (multidrug efflux system)